MGGVVGESALDEAGHGRCFLVAMELGVAEPGVVVDERVHPLVADPHPFLGAAAVAITGNGMTGPAEPDEAFGVDVEQITWAWPLVAAWLLARLLRPPWDPCPSARPRDRRMPMTRLAGAQPRAPPPSPPGSAD